VGIKPQKTLHALRGRKNAAGGVWRHRGILIPGQRQTRPESKIDGQTAKEKAPVKARAGAVLIPDGIRKAPIMGAVFIY